MHIDAYYFGFFQSPNDVWSDSANIKHVSALKAPDSVCNDTNCYCLPPVHLGEDTIHCLSQGCSHGFFEVLFKTIWDILEIHVNTNSTMHWCCLCGDSDVEDANLLAAEGLRNRRLNTHNRCLSDSGWLPHWSSTGMMVAQRIAARHRSIVDLRKRCKRGDTARELPGKDSKNSLYPIWISNGYQVTWRNDLSQWLDIRALCPNNQVICTYIL